MLPLTTQDDFDKFVASQRGVRELTLRDLMAWWEFHGHLEGEELYQRALADLTALAATYGDVSAAAAATFYEAARADSIGGSFRAIVGKSVAPGIVAKNLRWALAGEAPIERLAKIVDIAALQDGRETIMRNTARDPKKPRYARVPVGKTCAWCVKLGSRGAIYRTPESAGKGRLYHDDCDCQPSPSWAHGNDLPPGYDEGHYYGLYAQARAEANSSDPKKILAAMRRLDGGKHFSDGVTPSI